MSLAAQRARGRLPGLRGRAAALPPNKLRRSPKGAQGGSGPAARPARGRRPPALRGGQCPSRRVHEDARVAPGRSGAGTAGAAAVGVSRGVRMGAPSRARHASRHARGRRGRRRGDGRRRERPPRAAAKGGKQLERRVVVEVPRRLVDAETEWAPRYQGRRAPARRRSRTREARGSKSRFLDRRGPGRTESPGGGLRGGPCPGPSAASRRAALALDEARPFGPVSATRRCSGISSVRSFTTRTTSATFAFSARSSSWSAWREAARCARTEEAS